MKLSFSRIVATSTFWVLSHSFLQADIVKWKGQSGEYTQGSNWIKGEVPKTEAGDTALIPAGDVTYTPGGDLTMAHGGTLQISGGSWTQVVDVAYIRLSGSGSIVIDGGTFNQGTASSVPFATEDIDNVFNISNGTANITSNFAVNPGLNYFQSGGTVNVKGEFDFNTTTLSMSGGVLNATLITGVNAPDQKKAVFNFSGGVINLSGDTGIYGGNSTQYINFTPDSTGVINFNNSNITTTTVEAWLENSAIQIDNAPATPQKFKIAPLPQGGISIKLSNPKPKPAPGQPVNPVSPNK